MVPTDAKAVVITEGEFDAMAVFQATKMPAISLPFGANHLPLEALPWLEKFERIYLWMDADDVGKIGAEKFAQKLGVKRTLLVNTTRNNPKGPKDANDALRNGDDLLSYIKEARPLTQENILTFKEIKDEAIKRLINYNQNKGVLSNSFAWYNQRIKGFRKGELTILTGGTGSGKTTLLSQMSLDFMERGVPTLWGSFEIRNEVLASNMLIQFARKNLILDQKSIELYARDFESLPLYFLKFYGSTPIDQMLNTMDYAVYAYDVAHIIIDNLQFMLSGQAKGVDKFDLQDMLVSKLRDFASSHKIHISLVIHPKKVDEEHEDLSIGSIFGTAKATQEADNVLIMQNRYKYRYIDVRKNRFDGDTGRAALGYNKETKRFFELTEDEVNQINKSSKTVEDFIQEREKQGISMGGEDVKSKTMQQPQPTQAKEKPKIEALVEEDIKSCGRGAAPKNQQQLDRLVDTVSRSVKRVMNTFADERPCAAEEETVGRDDVDEESIRKDDIEKLKKIIGRAGLSANRTQQKPQPKIAATPAAKKAAPVMAPTPEQKLPMQISKHETPVVKVPEKKASSPPAPKVHPVLGADDAKPKSISYNVVGKPEWLDEKEIQQKHQKMLAEQVEKEKKEKQKAVAKTASDAKPNKRVYKSRDEGFGNAKRKKSGSSGSSSDEDKRTFGETFSAKAAKSSQRERLKLIDVLKNGGYLASKSRGKYGRSGSSSSSAGSAKSSSDRP